MVAPLVMAGIGAGLGGLSSLFGSNKPQQQSQSIDQASQDYITQAMRGGALSFNNMPLAQLDPAYLQALMQQQGYASGGLNAFNALMDPHALAGMMSPYQNAMNPYYDLLRRNATGDYNQRMAAGHTFGLRGRAAGPDLSMIDAQQSAAYGGEMNNVRNMLLQMGGMGAQAGQGLLSQGAWLTNRDRDWRAQGLGAINAGYGGPLTTTTTTPTEKPGFFQSMLGGAMTGLSFAGGPKAAPGAPAASFMRPMTPPNFPTFGENFRLNPMAGPSGFGQGY